MLLRLCRDFTFDPFSYLGLQRVFERIYSNFQNCYETNYNSSSLARTIFALNDKRQSQGISKKWEIKTAVLVKLKPGTDSAL